MFSVPPLMHEDPGDLGQGPAQGGPWAPFAQAVVRVGESSRTAGWAGRKGQGGSGVRALLHSDGVVSAEQNFSTTGETQHTPWRLH